MANVKWNGDALKKKLLDASKFGVDKTMSECVIQSKNNHPGWNNVTGFAEGSIRIATFGEEYANGVRGIWGSVNCNYMIWLELKHGSALRSAADGIYPRLTRHIREKLNG